MLTYSPADRAAPFAPPLDESAAWRLVGLALAPEDDATGLIGELAGRSVEFLAWSLVREWARSGRLFESLDDLRRAVVACGGARFLLGENNETYATSPYSFDSAELSRRLEAALPHALESEKSSRDPQRTFDRAAALAPAFALVGCGWKSATEPPSELPWNDLPLPDGWKRLWRRAALRHGIDERSFGRELIAAARDALARAKTGRGEDAPLAHRTLQRAAELALAHEASEEQFARRLDAERWASMKALAYGASHEINNPLANIASRAQALALDERDQDRLAKLRTIERQAFRAFTMIQNLTLVAEPPTPEIARFDWSAALDRFAAKWQEEASAKGIRLERADLPTPTVWVSADPAQMELVFDELVRNAIEVSPPATRIGVSGPALVREDEGDGSRTLYQVEIADEGSGLSTEARQRLFDPFYSGREAGRGQGFGLSKARRIVENHRGSLRCRERSPRGLAMQWLLPPADDLSE
jgi:signal transduction histidine kinase